MEKNEILYCKIAIAKYMGAEVTQAYPENDDQDGRLFYYPKDTSPDTYRNHSSYSIKYDTSADWLMPVFVKLMKAVKSEPMNISKSDLIRTIRTHLLQYEIKEACMLIVLLIPNK